MARGIAVPSHSRNYTRKLPAMTIFICKHCSSEKPNSNSWRNHERMCKENPNRYIIPGNGGNGRKGTNQYTKAKRLGLSKPILPEETRLRMSENAKKQICSQETKNKLSVIAKQNNLGGVTQTRWIKYKGKTLGSTYELSVAMSLDENDIMWETCKRFPYIDPFGKERTYTPDFYLPNFDVYLDPKNDFLIQSVNPRLGFSDLTKIKLVEEQLGIRILVLNKHQLSWKEIKELL